jgi:hypothetical protein
VKRLTLTAGMMFAVAVPGTAQAQLSHSQTTAYGRAYAHVRMVFGAQAAGCKLIGPHSTCNGTATDARILRSLDVLHRMFAPRPIAPRMSHVVGTSVPRTAADTLPYGGGLDDVPGVPRSFAACVAMRESTDGEGSSNIYGILGPGGQGSLAEQKQAFSQMYAQRGAEPWSPYDGC